MAASANQVLRWVPAAAVAGVTLGGALFQYKTHKPEEPSPAEVPKPREDGPASTSTPIARPMIGKQYVDAEKLRCGMPRVPTEAAAHSTAMPQPATPLHTLIAGLQNGQTLDAKTMGSLITAPVDPHHPVGLTAFVEKAVQAGTAYLVAQPLVAAKTISQSEPRATAGQIWVRLKGKKIGYQGLGPMMLFGSVLPRTSMFYLQPFFEKKLKEAGVEGEISRKLMAAVPVAGMESVFQAFGEGALARIVNGNEPIGLIMRDAAQKLAKGNVPGFWAVYGRNYAAWCAATAGGPTGLQLLILKDSDQKGLNPGLGATLISAGITYGAFTPVDVAKQCLLDRRKSASVIGHKLENRETFGDKTKAPLLESAKVCEVEWKSALSKLRVAISMEAKDDAGLAKQTKAIHLATQKLSMLEISSEFKPSVRGALKGLEDNFINPSLAASGVGYLQAIRLAAQASGLSLSQLLWRSVMLRSLMGVATGFGLWIVPTVCASMHHLSNGKGSSESPF